MVPTRTYGTLILLFFAATCLLTAEAVRVEELRVWKNKKMQHRFNHVAYTNSNDKRMVIGGKKSTGEVLIAGISWADGSKFKDLGTQLINITGYTNCSSPFVGILTHGSYDDYYYATYICEHLPSDKYQIISIKLEEKDGKVIKNVSISSDDFPSSEDGFNFYVAYLHSKIAIKYTDKKDREDKIFTLSGDLDLGYEVTADGIEIDSFSGDGSDTLYIGGTYKKSDKDYPYLGILSSSGVMLKQQYFNDDKIVIEDIVARDNIVQLCVANKKSADSSEIVSRGSLFTNGTSLATLKYKTFDVTTKGVTSCAAAWDGSSFFQTIGTDNENLMTWVYNSSFEVTQSYKMGNIQGEEKNEFYKFKGMDISTNSKGDFVFYAVTATINNQVAGALAILELDGSGSEFKSLGVTVENSDAPDGLAFYSNTFVKKTSNLPYTVNVNSSNDISKNLDLQAKKPDDEAWDSSARTFMSAVCFAVVAFLAFQSKKVSYFVSQ